MVPHRRHLLILAVVWMMVAAMLIIRGAIWVITGAHARNSLIVLGFLLVVVLGVFKDRLILSRAAARMISHIQHLDRRAPFWKAYNPSTYLTVVLMIGLGVLCRWAGAHWHIYWIIGYFYNAIGVALLAGSSRFWRAWRCAAAPNNGDRH